MVIKVWLVRLLSWRARPVPSILFVSGALPSFHGINIHSHPFSTTKMTTEKDTPKKKTTGSAKSSGYPTYFYTDEVEDPNQYVPGGYHVVHIGDVYHEHYRIVAKLGHGGYSTVWLAHDSRVSRYVALKISMADLAEGKPEQEIATLRDLQTDQPGQSYDDHHRVVNILDAFHITGPNGTHACYTMTPVPSSFGDWIRDLYLELPLARALAGGLVRAVAYIHRRGYVHGDLAFRNVLQRYPIQDRYLHHLTVDQFYETYGQPETEPVERFDRQPLSSGEGVGIHVPKELVISFCGYKPKGSSRGWLQANMRMQLCDFGEAYKPSTTTRLGRDCNTSWPNQPIEAYFMPDAPLSFPADIWTLGMVLWDTFTLCSLAYADFTPTEGTISQLVGVFGPLPKEWQQHESWRAFAATHYDEQGKPHEPPPFTSLDNAFDEGLQAYRKMGNAALVADDERAAFLDLLRRMMVYRPEDRITIEGVLQSEWMQKWALPALAEAEAVQAKEAEEAEAARKVEKVEKVEKAEEASP